MEAVTALPAGLRAAGIEDVAAYAVRLRRTFRRTTVREGLLLRGPAGWGEWAPFPEYDDVVAARWLAAALEAATTGWPATRRDLVTVNAIVPALAPQDAATLAYDAAQESGCATVKVKVAEAGQSIGDDVARVAAVRGALPPGTRIRVDANGGWTLAQAREALPLLGELEYVEQPCASLADCAAVRDLTRVALDEGIRLADDPAAARAELRAAADVVVLKAAPLGGVRAALAVAHDLGLPAVVSGALDTAIGLSAGLALAAALPEQPYAAGLGTGRLLAADVTARPVVPRGGALAVVRHVPDDTALRAAAMPVDRQQWWQQRLARAAALLATDAFMIER